MKITLLHSDEGWLREDATRFVTVTKLAICHIPVDDEHEHQSIGHDFIVMGNITDEVIHRIFPDKRVEITSMEETDPRVPEWFLPQTI